MEELAYIDLAFAKSLAEDNEEKVLLLAEILKTSREGKLSVDLGANISQVEEFASGENSPLVIENTQAFLRRNWELKEALSREIERINRLKPVLSFPLPSPKDLYPEQQEVLRSVSTQRVSIATGGPGTGKSYTALQLVKQYTKHFPHHKVLFAAPTGKALTKLRLPGVEAKTLHALLEIKRNSDFFTPSPQVDADLLIVDECSMIDLSLYTKLLRGLSARTRVLFIGDPDQLPPVEGTGVFRSLCSSNTFPSVKLSKCRRSDQHGILALSQAILRGDSNRVLSLLEDAGHTDIRLHELSFPTHFDTRTCYLTPFKKGLFGTENLNAKIDAFFTSAKKPILITKNDYTLGLMNGEIGFIEKGHAYFTKEGGNKEFPLSLLPPYDLAYALTVHKSQGSEFDHTTLFLPEGSEKFGRSLLYTAVTRAKKSLQIFGDKKTLISCLESLVI